MTNYDFEQLTQSARDSNLADYFMKSAYTTERFGAEIYVKEFPGLCINRYNNKWYTHYNGKGGSNAIDCLVDICGHDFKQAVYELTGRDISEIPSQNYPKDERPLYTTPPNKPQGGEEKVRAEALRMPERAENMRRVFGYFCKEREIPYTVVEELAHAKLLYQSSGRIETTVKGIPQTALPPNAVFVHRNEKGEEIGGEVQGVTSFKRYKGVVAGTGDSVFCYTPNPAKDGKPKTAYLFESGIDLMAFFSFCKREKMQGVMLVSMAGLKPSIPKQLQEQGVNVLSYVDNDSAGRKFEADHGFKRGTDTLEKTNVKDWGEFIKLTKHEPKAVKEFVPDNTPKKLFTFGGGRK
jgi:hypothetical protein